MIFLHLAMALTCSNKFVYFSLKEATLGTPVLVIKRLTRRVFKNHRATLYGISKKYECKNFNDMFYLKYIKIRKCYLVPLLHISSEEAQIIWY